VRRNGSFRSPVGTLNEPHGAAFPATPPRAQEPAEYSAVSRSTPGWRCPRGPVAEFRLHQRPSPANAASRLERVCSISKLRMHFRRGPKQDRPQRATPLDVGWIDRIEERRGPASFKGQLTRGSGPSSSGSIDRPATCDPRWRLDQVELFVAWNGGFVLGDGASPRTSTVLNATTAAAAPQRRRGFRCWIRRCELAARRPLPKSAAARAVAQNAASATQPQTEQLSPPGATTGSRNPRASGA